MQLTCHQVALWLFEEGHHIRILYPPSLWQTAIGTSQPSDWLADPVHNGHCRLQVRWWLVRKAPISSEPRRMLAVAFWELYNSLLQMTWACSRTLRSLHCDFPLVAGIFSCDIYQTYDVYQAMELKQQELCSAAWTYCKGLSCTGKLVHGPEKYSQNHTK